MNQNVYYHIIQYASRGEETYVICIEIHRYRNQGTLGLSKKAYIKRVLSR